MGQVEAAFWIALMCRHRLVPSLWCCWCHWGLLILNGQSPTDSEALNDRLTAIETRLEALETNTPEAVDAMSGQLEDLTEQIAEIEERMTTPPESEPAVSDNE